MDGMLWSRTMLLAQKNVAKVVGQLCRAVMGKAVGSYCALGASAERQAEDILALIARKERAELFQSICLKILKRLKPEHAGALYARFVARKTVRSSAALFGISVRAFYHRLRSGLKGFDRTRNEMGYKDDFLWAQFGKDAWVLGAMHIALACFEGVPDEEMPETGEPSGYRKYADAVEKEGFSDIAAVAQREPVLQKPQLPKDTAHSSLSS